MVNRDNMIHGRNIDRHPLSYDVGIARFAKHGTVLAGQAPQSGVIDTPEGQMTFQPGDYIVTDDPPTHAWPVRRDVFEGTYNKIGEIEPGQLPTSQFRPVEPPPETSAPAGDVVEQHLQNQASKMPKRGIASSETLAMNPKVNGDS